ncbi:MMPL family transporter [Dorea acetigenes]|uniref:MMPL family transporter n=1 Tax=Dorea acetigenes TaxID=2981787 RepID=A0ABT2RMI9_9FIRM|nr:MMPL family transporter [Dorea acetigenes]MCU6686551.1 MMPL family transporter [Dorea acetigenes]SCI99560.1 Putative membrane protein ydgH [uncultured Clostridium sp.]
MVKFGKKVVKYRIPILIASILLLVPAVFGYANTKVNYDVLTYLPEDIETMQGQEIMVEDFGVGAFSMFIVDGMEDKDVVRLKEKIEDVEHVTNVLWYDSVADISIPESMLPDDIYNVFNSDTGTMMAIFFDEGTSADGTMDAIEEIRSLAGKQCFLSGMSAIVTDTKNLAEKETPLYVLIAVALAIIVLGLTMDSFFVPVLFLLSIGMAILYNLGSNYFLGEISYITKALAAVLQLGVTLDYSIFLMHSYEEQQVRYGGDKERAMAHAISQTFSSVIGSSVTTIAGFIALCFMTFTLGMDIGVVMVKGVIFGVIACVTILPSMILCCDKWIEKTKHKPLLPDIGKLSEKVTKHYIVYVAVFLVLLVPAIYGNNHTGVYYNLDETLPKDLPSVIANEKLKEDYDMNTTHILLLDSSVPAADVSKMLKKVETVDGVKWALGLDKLVGPGVPSDMLPESVTSMLKNGKYQMVMVNSEYKVATDEVNRQIKEINKIVNQYDEGGMLIGEGPLTNDLIEITDKDFKTVSAVSIGIIFIIIMILFKSISLPVILVGVIEFAIFVNMGIPYYTGTTLPFVASIVIGTIQLGSTVDYAILMTTRYKRERSRGAGKYDAITIAHRASAQSILVSAFSFFAATIGVGLYSNIDMISSLCILMARGAIISMAVVVLVLPSMFMVFDKVIVKTSKDFLPKQAE